MSDLEARQSIDAIKKRAFTDAVWKWRIGLGLMIMFPAFAAAIVYSGRRLYRGFAPSRT
jgi:hypothetical protein